MDSWTFANAGADNDKIYSGYGDAGNDGVFSGGFAGKCDTGLKWQYSYTDKQWECSGQLNWEHKFVVPNLPSGSNGAETVGVYIRNKTFNSGSGSQALESVWSREQNEGLDVNKMDAMCFAGTSYSSDLSSDKWFAKAVEVPDTVNKPFFKVTGTIDMSGHDTYTCKWKFNGTAEGDVEVFDDDGRPPRRVGHQELVDLGVESGSNAGPEGLDLVSETSTVQVESSYP